MEIDHCGLTLLVATALALANWLYGELAQVMAEVQEMLAGVGNR
ncbi:hypothetical protein [Ferrimonas marina]|uniref:Uncharacterized protein n=1 Tax=Ferrimonas marina TaxID=299255 RepID=A0A1M5XDE3_9GAMM|nr:hypothetical protein [Ferrimonas marina]SHH97840.1 hypothetical protein SAMN02745129_3454 [Ferrimonas marina]